MISTVKGPYMNPTLTVGTLLLLVLSVIPAASQTTTVDVQG